MAVTPNSKPSAKNIKALNSLYKSGSITNITSGWHTFTFDKAYSVQPIVNVQAIGQGASSEVRNVGTTSFDYRVLANGADADGGAMQWFAYIEGASGDAVLDQINDIIGTDYDSIDDLLANQTDFAKVCASVPAMNVLFVYQPAIEGIADSEACIDTIMATSTSFQSLNGYIALSSAINSKAYGLAKRFYRSYSGLTDTSSIHDFTDVAESAQFSSMCGNQSAMTALFADPYYTSAVSNSAVLNGICRNGVSRYAFNSVWSRNRSNHQTIVSALSDTTSFLSYSVSVPDSDRYTVVAAMNAANPTGLSDRVPTMDGARAATADACFGMFVSGQIGGGSYNHIRSLIDGEMPEVRINMSASQNVISVVMAGGQLVDSFRSSASGTTWVAK